MKKTTLWAGSHIPVLVKLMQTVNKPVLELGMGWNSTPLLHWLCEEIGIPLLSLETDKEWIENFREFSTGSHSISLTSFEDFDYSPFLKQHYGLVFVDHRPARKRRTSAMAFKDHADFIVLHDSELAGVPAYKYEPIYKHFKYRYEYKSVGKPFTMILSNFVDVAKLLSSR